MLFILYFTYVVQQIKLKVTNYTGLYTPDSAFNITDRNREKGKYA